MTVVWSILSYIAALVIVLAADLLFTFLSSLLFIPLLRLVRPLYPAFSFVASCAATFVGIWAVAAAAAATPLRASVGMIAIPALLTYRNDRDRIQKVIAGVSGPKMLLAKHGEVESYNLSGLTSGMNEVTYSGTSSASLSAFRCSLVISLLVIPSMSAQL
jgi:hypothetical protein